MLTLENNVQGKFARHFFAPFLLVGRLLVVREAVKYSLKFYWKLADNILIK